MRTGGNCLKLRTIAAWQYTVSGRRNFAAHVTIMPRMGASVETAAGDKTTLSATVIYWHP